MEKYVLTRRGFITLSSIGALVAVSVPAPAQARSVPGASNAQGASRAAVLAGTKFVRASCFSDDWSERFDVRFPASIPIPKSERGGGVRVEWDSRLFAVEDVFALSTSGELSGARKSLTASALDVVTRADTQALIPVVRARTLYPNDALGDVRGSRLRFDRPQSTWTSFGVTRNAATPWGAELKATWLQTNHGAAADLIVIRSVGPHPIPRGAVITAGQPSTVRGNWTKGSTVSRAGAIRSGETFRLDKPLAAGDEQTIAFVPTVDSSAVLNGSGAPAIVSLSTSPRDWRNARETGAYDVASVTASGTQLAFETHGGN